MRLKIATFFVVLLAITISSCGGGVSGENGNDPFNTDDDMAPENVTLKIGHFNAQGQFVDGELGLPTNANGVSEISAGGSIGIQVAVVNQDNQRIQEATNVTFTSSCLTAEEATLTAELSTVNGEVNNTFVDVGCGGNTGTSDEISASVTNENGTIAARGSVDILADAIGSISFVSATPEQIILKGAGDSSLSASTITFLVTNERNAALPGQAVSFSLTTEIGGLALSATSATSNELGEVSTNIIAGTVPTPVRVNAQVIGANGESIVTQSDAIAVTTGLPSQRGFSFNPDILNVEGNDFNDETVNFTARLSDTFGNPVPDNTIVTFSTEGGQIASRCFTSNGACSAVWTSTDLKAPDGVVTVLATAIGHEALFDSNGNNVYDIADGEAIDDSSDSGRIISQFTRTGFVDISEAWRDDNENFQWDKGEHFLDYNSNKQFDDADGLFNGTQCGTPELCGQGNAATIHVRKSTVLIVSGSNAIIEAFVNNARLVTNRPGEINALKLSIARGESEDLLALVSDKLGNVMPMGTTISINTDLGDLTNIIGTVVPNISSREPTETTFTLGNNLADGDPAGVSRVTVLVTTPKGVQTTVSFEVDLL